MTEAWHSRLSALVKYQGKLAARAATVDDFVPDTIAGADQAFIGDEVISCIVMLDGDTLQQLGCASSQVSAVLPYIPTFLSFREGPAIISAFGKLGRRPGVLFVDGAGINHPRRAGLATCVGVELDVPTIGITKKILCGEGKQPEKEGDAEPLIYGGMQVGWLLASKKGCRPIVVAPGHRVSLESSLLLTRRCLRGHRLPEPLRLAHECAGRIKKSVSASL
ncbi:MAG TPA: endonuclease V [Candidatus Methanoperedenaceae archaeon]|nr:endonuclease V [Candidatus Methanoperedenaceae archaeon]